MSSLHRRTLLSTFAGFLCFFAVVFIPAGTLQYWQGWAFFLTLSISTGLATLYIALHNPKLLARRLSMGPTAETRTTQKIVTALGGPAFIIAFVGMVLDHRFGWSPPVPAWLSIAADVLMACGLYIYYRVTRENAYAAATVDVVPGQTVCATGPYAVIRHPMYAGALLVFFASPLALSSWWGLLIVPIAFAGFTWRLFDEERVLAQNLPGYTDYLTKVPYRLIPGVF